jgi:acyl-CoA synthetase (AMP-forming)/AMP-acid ligase II
MMPRYCLAMSAPWHTIPELIDDAARRFGSTEALVDGEVRWDFNELQRRSIEAGRAITASGVAPGERVAIWAPNIWEWVVAALGVYQAGSVLVPINTRFKGSEAKYVLEKSGAKLLFTVTDFLDIDYVDLLNGVGEIRGLNEIVVLRGQHAEGTTPLSEFIGRGANVDDSERADRVAAVEGDDMCTVMFTSGTTGAPKGAMLRHRATCRAYESWASVIGLRNTDRYLIINPFFHSFGLNAGIFACLMTGATMIPHSVFDVPSVMNRIPEERISMLPGPPAIYQTILNDPNLDNYDMSSLRLAVTGAAAIPVEMILQMRSRLGFENIVTGYGLTESTGIVSMCRADDDPDLIANTSGRAIDDVEMRIVAPDGTEVPTGEPGEIVVRGYNVMIGYLDDPEQTKEAIDADGWLHTGDIGVMDANSYIDITDRIKDMYIRGGENVYPAEVEKFLLSHPDIGGAAVVGVPDDRMGEVGMAFVIPAAGGDPDPQQIREWCRDKIANYKIPHSVKIVDAFPLNASGKVLKHELRESVSNS